MWLIVVSLFFGVVLGVANVVPVTWLRHLDKTITVTLFIMLLALGAQIGSNGQLVNNLPTLGWRAAVISTLSVAGSVFALWLVATRTALRERELK
ncbi:hypothetical protein SDC9_145170 [bioreactor metagenome]|uniref:DUF340 domain-containing protein n=1 Tax=bioreactor metagenome TaxID=1076179 RepID=A0A645E9A6_9ZZZZ